MRVMTHHPKGSMCTACAHVRRDCSALEFRSMPVLERYAGKIVVKCLEFMRQQPSHYDSMYVKRP